MPIRDQAAYMRAYRAAKRAEKADKVASGVVAEPAKVGLRAKAPKPRRTAPPKAKAAPVAVAAPPTASILAAQERIDALEAEVKRLKQALAAARATPLAGRPILMAGDVRDIARDTQMRRSQPRVAVEEQISTAFLRFTPAPKPSQKKK